MQKEAGVGPSFKNRINDNTNGKLHDHHNGPSLLKYQHVPVQGHLWGEAEEGRRVQQRQDGPGFGERERAVLEGGPDDERDPRRLLAKLAGGHRAQLDQVRPWTKSLYVSLRDTDSESLG